MMLAETEFRHQIEASIRSYREVLLGLFFITVGMLLDVGLLLRRFPMVAAIVVGMLVLKAAVVTLATKPATGSWFKSLRTGVVVGQGGEFGFALLTLLLRRELLDAAVVQPLLAAIVLSMVLSPILIRHNRRITRALLGETGPSHSEAMRETRATLAVAERDHVVICGFGRVGQNIARVLEQTGFEYIALDLDAYRIRVGRQAGDPVIYGDAGEIKVLENVGVAHASCVVITFANPEVALRILRAVRELRADVPILVRTQDDTKLEQLQSAGATEVVPETFEASLMLLSHLLLLLKLPVPRVIRTVNEIRSHRYSMLRQYFPAAGRRASGRQPRLSRGAAQRHPAAACLGGGPQHCRAGGAGFESGRQRGAARRHRRARSWAGHPIQGGGRRGRVRHPGGRGARRNFAADGLSQKKRFTLRRRVSNA